MAYNHWKCTNCHHEWDGSREVCDWCGGPGRLLLKANPCLKEGMSVSTCRYNPRLGCDCGFHKPDRLLSWEDPKTETEYRRKLNGL